MKTTCCHTNLGHLSFEIWAQIQRRSKGAEKISFREKISFQRSGSWEEPEFLNILKGRFGLKVYVQGFQISLLIFLI